MQTLLIQINQNELENIVKRSIREYFSTDGQTIQPTRDDLMTIAQAAEFLHCSIPTLYTKTSKRQIIFHKQGKRVYFSRRELEQWVKQG